MQLVSRYINNANEANQTGDFESAIKWCHQAIDIQPSIPEAWFNLGIALAQLDRREEALHALEQAQLKAPNSPEAQNSIGLQFLRLNAFEYAEKCLSKAIELAPHYAFPYSNLGQLRQQQNKLDEAEKYYRFAISLQPDNPGPYINLGSALVEKRAFDIAEPVCRKAVELAPDLAQAWNNLASTLVGLGRPYEAEEACRKAIGIAPNLSNSWGTLANIYIQLNRLDEALNASQKDIRLAPQSHEAWGILGAIYLKKNHLNQAEAALRKSAELAPENANVWRNLGNFLCKKKLLEEGLTCLLKAAVLNPALPYLQAELLYSRLQNCDWSDLSNTYATLTDQLSRGIPAGEPFRLNLCLRRADLLKQITETYASKEYPQQSFLGPVSTYNHSKIRLGVFSADFKYHPVWQLSEELFATFDKARFELTAFSLTEGSTEEIQARLAKAFDRAIDVRSKNYIEIARLARELEIDIAIDLGGYTDGHCPAIFALRAAPIQVAYLGFPGTMGAPYINYLLCDSVVCPPGSEAFYTEKLARLPHCFMPHNSTQSISDRVFTRAEFGLPEEGFVFCCFNNHYKINPDVFDVWMRLLQEVPGSVLWLSDANQLIKVNLNREARARGVAPERLLFAPRLESMAEHLARYRLADLFIDTWPYNAHTTACDSLWAGVPVLTCAGETFASRVAASLLTNIGLRELITTDSAGYEALALELATRPDKLKALREKLSENRLTAPLFDTKQLTRDMEQLFIAMVRHHLDKLTPEELDS